MSEAPQGLPLSQSEARKLLIAALRRSGGAPAVVLEGDPGAGRSLLVRAAVEALRAEGEEVGLKELALDDWEPDRGVSLWTAAAAALGAGGGAAIDRDAFRSTLSALAPPSGTLVLHVPCMLTVPDLLLDLLIDEAGAARSDVRLILQASPGELASRALPAFPAGSRKVRLEPLTSAELRTVLEAGFGAEAWSLLRGRAASSAPAAVADVLGRLIALAGLCGTGAFPAQLLLAAAGVEGEMADAVLDILDQELVRRGLLEDLEYGHPSCPDQAVYRFSSPLAARAAGEALPELQREELAAALLSFMHERLGGPCTRGAGRTLAGLARGTERERALLELAWWTGREEAVAQEQLLDGAVEAGRVPAEILWRVFEGAQERWPAYRLLPLLTVYGRRAAVPSFRVGELSASRAMLLFDLKRDEEAAREAREALERLERRGQEARLAVASYAILGLTALESGSPEAARAHLGAAAEAAVDAEPGGGVAGDVTALGRELRALSSRDLLRRALAGTLEISRRVDGFEGRRGADLWLTFSDLFRDGGRLGAARDSLERALVLTRRLTGPVDPQAAIALKNLAELQRSLGNGPGEREALEKALVIETELYGRDAARTVALRAHLVELLLRLEDFAPARPLLEQAVEIARKSESGSGELVVLLKHLGDVCLRQGDREAAAGHLAEALALDEAAYGKGDPRITVLLKQLADLHRAQGDAGRGIQLLLRALRIEERVYGLNDPRLLPNLRMLEVLLRRRGGEDAVLADSLRRRVRRIESDLQA